MMLFVVLFKLAVEGKLTGRRGLFMNWLLASRCILELQSQIKIASPGERMGGLERGTSFVHAVGGAGPAFFEPKYLASPMANLG